MNDRLMKMRSTWTIIKVLFSLIAILSDIHAQEPDSTQFDVLSQNVSQSGIYLSPYLGFGNAKYVNNHKYRFVNFGIKMDNPKIGFSAVFETNFVKDPYGYIFSSEDVSPPKDLINFKMLAQFNKVYYAISFGLNYYNFPGIEYKSFQKPRAIPIGRLTLGYIDLLYMTAEFNGHHLIDPMTLLGFVLHLQETNLFVKLGKAWEINLIRGYSLEINYRIMKRFDIYFKGYFSEQRFNDNYYTYWVGFGYRFNLKNAL
jgi:hypothetical protein